MRPARSPAADEGVAVIAPSPVLTITVEPDDEIHLHAGGQGFWVARMIARLGVPVTLCCALGSAVKAYSETPRSAHPPAGRWPPCTPPMTSDSQRNRRCVRRSSTRSATRRTRSNCAPCPGWPGGTSSSRHAKSAPSSSCWPGAAAPPRCGAAQASTCCAGALPGPGRPGRAGRRRAAAGRVRDRRPGRCRAYRVHAAGCGPACPAPGRPDRRAGRGGPGRRGILGFHPGSEG
jgi:hypothetical protein